MSTVEKSNAYSASYREVLERIEKRDECPFCWENLKKEHPRPILFQSEYWLVTENAFSYQKAAIKFLIIFRNHTNEISEVSLEAWIDLLRIYKVVISKYNLIGCALLMRQGEPKMTGATVKHLHAHVLGGNGEEGSEPITARVG